MCYAIGSSLWIFLHELHSCPPCRCSRWKRCARSQLLRGNRLESSVLEGRKGAMAINGTAVPIALDDTLKHYIDMRMEAADQAWKRMILREANETLLMSRENARDMDIGWLIICGALVFFMQAGFAMLEAGVVHPKNVHNILFKNMIDASIAAICFWLLGWGFAYGEDVDGFIGNNYFAASDIYNWDGAAEVKSDGWEKWFFQWAFAGTCATIVAGSVAERTRIEAYFIYSIFLTSFTYPVVAHWGWGSGWLSAWGGYPDNDNSRGRVLGIDAGSLIGLSPNSNGMVDFAGAGIVHMVGGFAGLVGAIVVGPRRERFTVDGRHRNHPANAHHGNKTLQALGTMILWFAWYGVTCGKTLKLSGGAANIAAKAAINTTIAAASGCLVSVFQNRSVENTYDVSMGLNGILAGLVSITAGCSVVEPWMAGLIGSIGALILYVGHHVLVKLRIDDPLDACVVHGLCGMWSLWATGLFCTDDNLQYAAYPNTHDANDACASGAQLGVQVFASLAIAGWTLGTSAFIFLCIAWTVGMRVSDDLEETGLDPSEHGSQHSRSFHGIQNYPLRPRLGTYDFNFLAPLSGSTSRKGSQESLSGETMKSTERTPVEAFQPDEESGPDSACQVAIVCDRLRVSPPVSARRPMSGSAESLTPPPSPPNHVNSVHFSQP